MPASTISAPSPSAQNCSDDDDPDAGGAARSGTMKRLVIVSNRVADLHSGSQTGGLAVGLADALKERGGVWFGWDGERERAAGGEPKVERVGKVERIASPLGAKDFSDYYAGYANSVLWPLFHYRPDLVNYHPQFFAGYCRVNDIFARRLAPFLKQDDLIWAHDYHLIPLASRLRRLGCRQKMGFFLHIPFPPPELLSASPNHIELVDGLLDYDLIGLQTHTDADNLKHYLSRHTPAVQIAPNRFSIGGRTITVDRFPIGIDAPAFAQMACQPDDAVEIDLMRRHILGRQQIIGVDRLDYSKGLPERMKAFGLLLSQYPQLEKAVTYLQIAPPTREELDSYAEIRMELEGLAGSINGRFADFNWTPVRYIHRSIARPRLAPLLRGSQVGFVTPLRDGMNLVAKEYVAAQDPDDPGVLVLSQFAGAAEEMSEALIVNPYDSNDMAQKLYQALTMPIEERRERHAALYSKVERNGAKAWLTTFLSALESPAATGKGDRGEISAPAAAWRGTQRHQPFSAGSKWLI